MCVVDPSAYIAGYSPSFGHTQWWYSRRSSKQQKKKSRPLRQDGPFGIFNLIRLSFQLIPRCCWSIRGPLSTSTPPRFSASSSASRRMSGFSGGGGQISSPSRLSSAHGGRRSTRGDWSRDSHLHFQPPHPTPSYQRDTIASLAKQSPRKLSPSIEERIRVLEAEIAILKNQRGFLATMIRQEKHADRHSLTTDEIAAAAERLGVFEKLEEVAAPGGDPEKSF
ncbi:hypothetical protein DFP73DRAFT_526898 [Morchella snyderi]|nr:hypothetical protein DFP73DRAFT_526898 [Morchella snyderi]